MNARLMINNALRVLRIYWGLSQAELASELGLSQSMISGIEGGSKPVSMEILERYSEKLGVRMSQLLFFAEDLDLEPDRNKTKRFLAERVLSALERILPDEKE